MLKGTARQEYERQRAARKHDVRPQVYRVRGYQRKQVHLRLVEPPDPDRPRTRGECIDGPRPCPWVSCRYSLYLDVSPKTGSIKLNRPELEPDEQEHSCVLDIADAGGATMERVGELMNMTRERIRQIEGDAFRKLSPSLEGWNDDEDE